MINKLSTIIKTRKTNLDLTGVNGAEKAYLLAKLFSTSDNPFVVILPSKKDALKFMDDLAFFMPKNNKKVIYFPGYNILPFKSLSYHSETAASRISALYRITTSADKYIVVTYIDTFLQKMIPKNQMVESADLVINQDEIDRDYLIARLDSGGYVRTSLVEEHGEYSVRGGILDIFSPGSFDPVRIEFFGDYVESLRSFSPVTQRGIKELEETVIIPANEAVVNKAHLPHLLGRLRKAGTQADVSLLKIREYVEKTRELGRFPGMESMLSIVYETLDSFFDYFPETALFILDRPGEIESRAGEFEKKALDNFSNAIQEKRLCVTPDSIYMPWNQVKSLIAQRKPVTLKPVHIQEKGRGADPGIKINLDFEDNSMVSSNLRHTSADEYLLKPLADWFIEKKRSGIAAVAVCSNETRSHRLVSLLQPYGIDPVFIKDYQRLKQDASGIFHTQGNLSSGFVLQDEAIAFITDQEIFGTRKRRIVRGKRRAKSEFITPEELKKGDIVVHIEHGLGRYEGLVTIKVEGISGDFILISYRDDDRLYLPVDRMEMVEKYLGVDGYTPLLDKIGGKTWLKSKTKAKKEVEKMAGELLKLYAERRVKKGFAFSASDTYFNDFEASFPYDETPDQIQAIYDVLSDMEDEIPMDRLVCGDVGYGKTEVAIRAAFKAVNDGKQVAIVVPTTILAEQHLLTFKDRFRDYPVTIEALSRFRTKKEQNVITKKINAGTVDVVIGTHRLLQKDIEFNSLGLLVIDEEQRFGVRHKEVLKKKRSIVDVLALTATPIPRTLHMSLTGMRDISVITTPPRDRQAIFSYISEYDDAVVSEAIKKELARNGQIFFIHNSIKSIDKTAQNLQKLVPEVRLGIAHGRLTEANLEKTMFQFINRKIDMLVCTTIVESGLDIPSANTMIINRADRFGLSQIYQLRGRIGRGEEQAYAYLFVPDENRLTRDAQKRLAALMEHRDLGSGFQIAMKDLQIRGSGSALGASQSGHIAAVGYDMFLKLLDEAVSDLKGKPVTEPLDPEINMTVSAYISEEYIQSIEQRLTIYRRLSQMTALSEIASMQKELVDRFGKLPEETANMLLKIMLRVLCIKAGVKRLDLTGNLMVLVFSHRHQKHPYRLLDSGTISAGNYEFASENTLRIFLGSKRITINNAMGSAKKVLNEIALSVNS